MSDEPWLRDGTEVASTLGADLEAGLTNSEAAARLKRIGPNRLDPTARVPAWRKLLAQFADPLVYLLLVAVAISLAT